MSAGISLNNKFYPHQVLVERAFFEENLSPFEKDIVDFYSEWHSTKNEFEVNTSGSTGSPKKIFFSREKLIISARQTIDTFSLQREQNVLLCLSPRYIAGKMMIVRALVGGLNIIAIEPSENPLLNCDKAIHFAAFVPSQLVAILANPQSSSKLADINVVLIGGGTVDSKTVARLTSFPNNIYQTFGMTETLTHIAVKKISGPNPEAGYTLLHGVKIKSDERNCLAVKSPVNEDWVQTNDIVDIEDLKHFRWIGRNDNVVNSGGIKISPEEIEPEIDKFLIQNGLRYNFFVAGIPDEKLGQRLVLILEGEEKIDQHWFLGEIKKLLPKYKSPKNVILCPNFSYTTSGKIKRKETLNLVLKNRP